MYFRTLDMNFELQSLIFILQSNDIFSSMHELMHVAPSLYQLLN